MVMEVRLDCPFTLAFWHCLHWDSRSLQWVRRDWYVSRDWSWSQIESLSSWYCMACCRTMIFSISWVWVGELALGNEGSDAGGQGMDTLTGELVDIREEVIPEVPEMLLRLDSSTSSIKGKLGHSLTPG